MNINGKWYTESQIEAYVTELENKVAELEAKHWNECRQIAHYSDELRKAKELLKAAVEDIVWLNEFTVDGEGGCLIEKQVEMETCLECPLNTGNSHLCGWRHQAEALALIGEGTNVPASADDTNVGHKSGGWISCEDRLPSENTLVLCYARSTTGEGNGYFLGGLALGEFWFLKVNDIGHVSYPVPHWEVTHWQPLPEPPKDGDTND